MVSPRHSPSESDTRLSYGIYKETVFWRLTYREIDHTSFPFNDFYIPGLTPRIHCSEAALQFVENTTFTFLYHVNRCHQRKEHYDF
jgi:hypothetical protein